MKQEVAAGPALRTRREAIALAMNWRDGDSNGDTGLAVLVANRSRRNASHPLRPWRSDCAIGYPARHSDQLRLSPGVMISIQRPDNWQ